MKETLQKITFIYEFRGKKKQKLQRMYAPAAISIVVFTKDYSSDNSRSQTSGIDKQLRNGILF